MSTTHTTYFNGKGRLEWRLGMVKSIRRHIVGILFAFFAVFTASLGFVEGGGGFFAASMVLGTLFTLLLIFGVEVRKLEYGEFRIVFESYSGGEDKGENN
jgi:hypothetical protein